MSGETLRFSTSTPIPITTENPLTTLIHRLEAATSRLEDIASSATEGQQQQEGQREGHAGSISQQSGIPASSSMPELASKDGAREASTVTVQPALPQSIQDMDELLGKEVKEFQEASKGLDALIDEQVRRRKSMAMMIRC